MSDWKDKRASRLRGLEAAVATAVSNETTKKLVGVDLAVRKIDPKVTRMHPMHQRAEVGMSGEAIADLVASFEAIGQKTPAKGYWLEEADGPVEIELIYGARRRAAALALGIELDVRIVERPSQLTIAREMLAENEARLDYTLLERAREFHRMVSMLPEEDQLKGTKQLAADLGVSWSTYNRMVRVLELPAEILSLFDVDPRPLTVRFAAALGESVKDPIRRQRLVQLASELGKSGATAQFAAGQLTAVMEGESAVPDPVVFNADDAGAPAEAGLEAAGLQGIKPAGSKVAAPGAGPVAIDTRRELFDGTRRIGKVIGMGEASSLGLTVRLTTRAPAELRSAIEAALAPYIPK